MNRLAFSPTPSSSPLSEACRSARSALALALAVRGLAVIAFMRCDTLFIRCRVCCAFRCATLDAPAVGSTGAEVLGVVGLPKALLPRAGHSASARFPRIDISGAHLRACSCSALACAARISLSRAVSASASALSIPFAEVRRASSLAARHSSRRVHSVHSFSRAAALRQPCVWPVLSAIACSSLRSSTRLSPNRTSSASSCLAATRAPVGSAVRGRRPCACELFLAHTKTGSTPVSGAALC
mmetsp:Transcript_6932/g.20884  ORF Transcript_6932/g.20884 Transcript_6932/m.20884 type:complete len:241 (+) Transcript_6932:1413-2135(+)